MIITNVPPILHCFGDTAFQMSKIAIVATPLAFKLPDGGVPLDVNGWPRYQMVMNNCQKFQPADWAE